MNPDIQDIKRFVDGYPERMASNLFRLVGSCFFCGALAIGCAILWAVP